MRADLAERVQEAVALLGYRRDLTATNLRRADRQSANIGLVFDDVANPFHAAVLTRRRDRGPHSRGPAAGRQLGRERRRERELAEAFLSRRVDGLIVVPAGSDHSYLRADRDAGVALVFVDRPPAIHRRRLRAERQRGGAFEATGHLIAAGHTRIGFLGDETHIFTGDRAPARLPRRAQPARHRLRRDAGADGPAPQRRRVRGDGRPAARPPIPPTALFTAQNLITIGAVERLRALDRHRTVALVGFDDLPLADVVEPGLTVVAQDADQLGRLTAEQLFARLDGDDGPTVQAVVPTTLIARGSGELAP